MIPIDVLLVLILSNFMHVFNYLGVNLIIFKFLSLKLLILIIMSFKLKMNMHLNLSKMNQLKYQRIF